MFTAPVLPSLLAGLTELPDRLRIAKWGVNESVNGNFTVNATTAKYLPILQKLVGWDTVPLDFEHNTVPGTDAYKADKEPRNVAAHAALSVVAGEGIYAEGIKWTPHGEKSIKEGLHPDLSPTIKTNEAGEVVLMHSAALCRAGAVLDLKVFSAMDLASMIDAAKFAAFTAAFQPVTKTHTMDYKKLLIILLGLDANASDADVEIACKKFSETSGVLQTFAANHKKLVERLETLEKNSGKSEREAIIAQAVRDGKLVPNSTVLDRITDLEALRGVMDALPAGIVPVAQRTADGLKAHAASLTTAPNAAEAEVARQMGNSAENIKKYGDKRA